MHERKKVLIVDDEVDLCLLMKTYFLRKNYEVYTAHNFLDCLSLAKKCLPNIILLESALCPNPAEDIKRLKEEVPGVEIFVDGFDMRNRF